MGASTEITDTSSTASVTSTTGTSSTETTSSSGVSGGSSSSSSDATTSGSCRPPHTVRSLRKDAAGDVDAKLSPLLADLVRAALDTARRTAGTVDPTVARALVGLGYDQSFPQLSATRHDSDDRLG